MLQLICASSNKGNYETGITRKGSEIKSIIQVVSASKDLTGSLISLFIRTRGIFLFRSLFICPNSLSQRLWQRQIIPELLNVIHNPLVSSFLGPSIELNNPAIPATRIDSPGTC